MKAQVNNALNKWTDDLKKSVRKEVASGNIPSPSVFFISNEDATLNIYAHEFEGSVNEHADRFRKECNKHSCCAVCYLIVFDQQISFIVETPANYFISVGEIKGRKLKWNDQVFGKDNPATKNFSRIVEDVIH